MLPFDAESLFAAIGGYHRGHPLAAVLAPVAAALALLLALRGPASARRAVPFLLAGCWLWIGVAWHLGAFAQLNFAAPAYGALFVLQGFVLAWLGIRDRLRFGGAGGWAGAVGVALALLGIVAMPLGDGLLGWPWSSARLAGMDPCPTAVLTLGILLLARPPRPLAMIIPVLWTIIAAATGWVLGIGPDMALPLAALAAVAGAFRRSYAAEARISA